MIKAIIFDCFGVLYVHHGPEFIKNNAVDYDKIKDRITEIGNQVDYGLLSQDDYEQQLAELCHIPIEEVHLYIFRGFGRNEDLVNYITTYLKPHYKIAMLSNISYGSMDKFFTKDELARLFDYVALSGETNSIKPNQSAYIEVCNKLKVDTSEVVMIDDNPENIRGAIAAGLKAIDYDGLAHLRRNLDNLLKE